MNQKSSASQCTMKVSLDSIQSLQTELSSEDLWNIRLVAALTAIIQGTTSCASGTGDQPEASLAFCWQRAGMLSLLPPPGVLQHIFNSSAFKKNAAALLSGSWIFKGWFTSHHTPVSDDIQGLTADEKHLLWRHCLGVVWGLNAGFTFGRGTSFSVFNDLIYPICFDRNVQLIIFILLSIFIIFIEQIAWAPCLKALHWVWFIVLCTSYVFMHIHVDQVLFFHIRFISR